MLCLETNVVIGDSMLLLEKVCCDWRYCVVDGDSILWLEIICCSWR